MSEWVDIPLPTGLGSRENKSEDGNASYHASRAMLWNLEALPTPPETRSGVVIQGTPGWPTHANQPGASGALRGACIRADGTVFVVRGTSVYYGTGLAAWTVVPVGTMPGTGKCRMADAGTHVVCVDGTNARAITVAESFACSRANFSDVAYQDGYTIFTETGSNSMYISALDDPTTIDALDFTTVDALPGDLVGVISDHRELYAFKETSIEHYYNAGGAGFPFVRGSPGVIEQGCAMAYSIAKRDNVVFWIGSDSRVYTMAGYQPKAVSTPAVDEIIRAQIGLFGSWVMGAAYEYDGSVYYAIGNDSSAFDPNSAVGVLIYNATADTWHGRTICGNDNAAATDVHYPVAILNLSPTSSGYPSTVGIATNTDSGASGTWRTLSGSDGDDSSGLPPTRTLIAPAFSAGGRRVTVHELYLDAGKMVFDGTGTVTLQWSDDGGETWSTGRSGTHSGAQLRWLRLGQFRGERIFRIIFSDAGPGVQIMGLRARIDVGE